MARIFLVEDNEFIREGVAEYFQLEDHEVVEFAGADGVLERMGMTPPDLVILDIMLPDGNGFRVARDIRRHSDVPIIFLTAKEAETDRITGFEVGGDDYVVKPFSTKELVMRAKALLRRSQPDGSSAAEETSGAWRCGGNRLAIDSQRHEARVNDEPLKLTSSEWELLCYLAARPSQVLSRRVLLGECLDYVHDGSTRTVDTHIANLRNKLGNPDWIETVRGYGYRFTGTPDSQS